MQFTTYRAPHRVVFPFAGLECRQRDNGLVCTARHYISAYTTWKIDKYGANLYQNYLFHCTKLRFIRVFVPCFKSFIIYSIGLRFTTLY